MVEEFVLNNPSIDTFTNNFLFKKMDLNHIEISRFTYTYITYKL